MGWNKYPEGEQGEPSDNLYIANLPESFDTDSVQQFFAAIGNVVQCKSFGYGYALVRFASLDEAKMVKESLGGQQPMGCGKPLTLTYALADKKNDWKCPRCGDVQFQKNTQCRMCGCPRPQTNQGHGAGDADSSGAGLPSYAESGDWTCGSCGDLQFKKNTQCRLCGAPAPGKGGGEFGKAKGKFGGDSSGPYPVKGKGKGKGAMCTVDELINELIQTGLPGAECMGGENLVQISGLPPDCTEENLYQIFNTFGALPPKGASVEQDGSGQCDGTASVNFIEGACADMAVMALNGISLCTGQKLKLVRT